MLVEVLNLLPLLVFQFDGTVTVMLDGARGGLWLMLVLISVVAKTYSSKSSEW